MDNIEILKQQISEQIALEEHLCKVLEEQLIEFDDDIFSEAKNTLEKAVEVLEKNYSSLNETLDKLEENSSNPYAGNGVSLYHFSNHNSKNRIISKMLRDDYSALNLITISNTLLHTTALALDSEEIANLALNNLKLLAPIVVRLGELVPNIAIKELNFKNPKIDLKTFEIALKNTKDAWSINEYS